MIFGILVVSACGYWLSQANYPFFHTAAEGLAITVAAMVFTVTSTTYFQTRNSFYYFLSAGYLFVAIVDLFHLATYSGANLIPEPSPDVTTQLWIAGRYLFATTFLAAPLFFHRDISRRATLAAFAAVTTLLLTSIFVWSIFPVCFVEGQGLTTFKITSEYVICLILAAGIVHLKHHKGDFHPISYSALITAMVITIASEMCFTFYFQITGPLSLIGHLLKVLAYVLVFQAIVLRNIRLPYLEIHQLNAQLEARVQQRTEELQRANARLEREVQERKELEERLLRAHRMETAGKIAAQVAHDFNNLLGPMVAYPDLIKMQLPEDHPAVAHCDAMIAAAERMANINTDMLDLARRGLVERSPVDIPSLVRHAIDHLGDRPDSLAIDLDLSPDLLPASGSEAQLLRVISNLLSNAREAMHDRGTIRIAAKNVYVDRPIGRYNRVEIGEYIRISVRDEGHGIPPEIKDKIFDAFFTTKSADKKRGSGLGLSVVQALVDDHKGYLDLDSEPGKGSTFSIYLPVHRGPIEEKVEEGLPHGNEKVLVVDDDPLQREVSRQMLQTLGYDVQAVESGEKAVDLLKKDSVDLLLLDVVMPPGIDGPETYRRVVEFAPRQKALLLSGFAEPARVEYAQSLGALGYLRKPISLERLARAVRKELDG